MTTAPAAIAPASFAHESYGQRQPDSNSGAFAREFDGYAASHDRAQARHSGSVAKTQKGNNVEQAAVATPAPAANLQLTPLSLQLDFEGTQSDSPPAVEPASANPLPMTTGAPQQPDTTPEVLPNAPGPQNTAFMMRMQVASPGDGATPLPGLGDAGIAGNKKIEEQDGQDSPSLPEAITPGHNPLAVVEQSREMQFGAAVKQAAPVQQTAELRAVRPEEPVRAPQPLNHLLLQVNQSANEKVVIRLVQQSGELRLAVRTDDTELTHGLQQGLSDLVGKLQENGYRTDAWQPVHAPAAAGPTLESQNASNHSRQGDPQSQPGWSQQGGGQQQQNQPNRPRWVEELESSLTTRTQPPGESHGFTS